MRNAVEVLTQPNLDELRLLPEPQMLARFWCWALSEQHAGLSMVAIDLINQHAGTDDQQTARMGDVVMALAACCATTIGGDVSTNCPIPAFEPGEAATMFAMRLVMAYAADDPLYAETLVQLRTQTAPEVAFQALKQTFLELSSFFAAEVQAHNYYYDDPPTTTVIVDERHPWVAP